MATGTGNGDGGRLLLIDDERVLLRAFRRMLTPAHEVVLAQGGAEALDVLRSDQGFDLILCDLSMPRVNGIDVYEFVRDNTPELIERIVFLTGGTFDEPMERFVADVDNEIVEKPLTPDQLRSVVSECLRRWRSGAS